MPRVLLLTVAVLLTAGCRSDPSSARGTAERFLDAYYVTIDLRAAAPYTSGLAREKVDRSIALVGNQTIDAATDKPSVHYALLEERPDGDDAASFAYLGTITTDGGESSHRRWLVTVRREAEGWRVTNFQEEPAP